MSYLDESEYDDDPDAGVERPAGADGRRRATPAGPAGVGRRHLRHARRPAPGPAGAAAVDRYAPRYDETTWSSAEPSAPSSDVVRARPVPAPHAPTSTWAASTTPEPEYARRTRTPSRTRTRPATRLRLHGLPHRLRHLGVRQHGVRRRRLRQPRLRGGADPSEQPAFGRRGTTRPRATATRRPWTTGQRVSAGMTAYPGGLAEDPGPAAGSGRAGRNLPAAIGVGVGLAAAVARARCSSGGRRSSACSRSRSASASGSWSGRSGPRGVNPPLDPAGRRRRAHDRSGLVGARRRAHLRTDRHRAGGDGLAAGRRSRRVRARRHRGHVGRGLRAVPGRLRRPAGQRPADGRPAGAGDAGRGGALGHRWLHRRRAASAGIRWPRLVSPKKSWEGLAGSLVATAVGGAVLLYFLFDVRCGGERCSGWPSRPPPCSVTWASR